MVNETFETAAATSVSERPNPTNRGRGEGHDTSEWKEPEAAMAKKKVVVVMGATGAGKSRLAIELASHFAGVEIINADSMQVYRGVDILTNKVPLSERKGVPHHLLGTIDPSSEFTSRDFRNLAIPIIDDVLARGCLPVIVGGTNYYIQALVSPYLVDDVAEDMAGGSENSLPGDIDLDSIDSYSAFELLKEIDPIAANRFHSNEHRKIRRYLGVYASSGVLPSKLFNGKAAEKRRLNRLKTYFSWNLQYIDATRAFLDEEGDSWSALAVEPCVKIVRTFLLEEVGSLTLTEAPVDVHSRLLSSRDLCTQYVCEACGNQVLRGAHEWEQHKKGRVHRKRVLRLKKQHLKSFSVDQQTDNCAEGKEITKNP